MSDCCSDHNNESNEKKEEVRIEKMPKSFVRKYFYKLGKEKVEKSKK